MAAAPKKDTETTATAAPGDGASAADASAAAGPQPDGIAAVEVGGRKGLRVPRFFTTPGVHPYDELEWELRDAVIKNWRDDSVSFEQRGVEFPTTWSMNATTIVAQKYFRGQLGTPERERSVKQMVDRVADTITEWGRADGYFVDDESAETFNLELKHLLVNQKMAFNSPVWFNIGVKDVPQQASACFILAVEDTMSSILNWYVEEGIIFKGGSGAGVNLSKIRSSKENLRGGGEASGPVSFMRGADASAGTIKSGGKTRRAAKMVILNSNHPDIEDFIWCKAREEKKARVLREAGFDMDLDSPDYASIQYQNANNSVRVDDDFMRAWENDEDYDLVAVTTGEPIETKKARDLMRQIAQAAWECADPGMQYDTTINRWHTAPESGRINGSNPCSEYMHLDNSACNLASLNLKTFYDYEADRFDVEAYERAVDITITAQEILVGNSSYPTEKIGETARAFRQLGLGYANLGGLLMSLGLPYDSDEGRAWCGALTALMTGRAYRTSAQMAAVVGPFAGYAKNASAMANVIGMHRAAAEEIDPRPLPEDLLAAAKRSWQEADEFGAEYGWRNSQASVLAPTGTISFLMDCDTTGIEPDLGLVKTKKLVGGGSMSIVNQTVPQALRRLGYNEEQVEAIVEYIDEHKTLAGAPVIRDEHRKVFQCAMGDDAIHYMGHVKMMAAAQPFISGAISKCVVGETLVATEDGLVRIGSLYDGEGADSFRDHVMEVASLEGTQKTDAFYYGGVRPVREVVLRSGHRIVGTPNHRLLVATPGGLQWKMLHDIEDGDYVATQYGSDMWSPVPARFDDFDPSPRYGNQKDVTVPAEMTEDLAFLLGAYVSEGHTTRTNWTVSITTSVDEVLDRVADAWRSVFGIEPRIDRPADRCPAVVVSSKTVVEFLEHLGAGARASEKRIPDAVLRSTREQVLAFLQGLSLDAYAAWMGVSPKWAICVDSPALLDDLQAVLTNLGVVHGRISKLNKDNGKTYDEVYATGQAAQQLIELLPFVEPDKRHRAETLLQVEPQQSTSDVVPGITPRELYELIPYRTRNADGVLLRTEFNFLHDPRTKNVSRRTLERVAAIPGIELPDWIGTVLDDGLHFSPVASVEDAGEREVFDISVPTTHAFVGNGVVNHNTANMPEEATVEDVEQLFYDAWKLGLKAIAIYRDNCKVAQPLAVTKKEGAAAIGPVEVTAGMVRRKLPKQRPSQTISFRVADAEGYLTAGEYPGDGLGEIFVKLGKQGSTLSGVMDAFAISMSLGLQYGVPLEAYVSKFMNMRFEPAGMTDDDEIRFATSIVDYLARKLAIEYLPADKRAGLGIFTTDERTAALDAQYGGGVAPTDPDLGQEQPPVADRPTLPTTALGTSSMPADADAPLCFSCGIKMKRAGSCHVCEQCGSTSGCS